MHLTYSVHSFKVYVFLKSMQSLNELHGKLIRNNLVVIAFSR